MTSSAVAMMTKAILLLTLFGPLISAAQNATEQNSTTPDAPDYTNSTEYTSLSASTQMSTSNAPPPQSSSPSSQTTGSTTTTKPTTPRLTALTTQPTTHQTSRKFYILMALLFIIILMLLVGCIHAIWERQSGRDSTALRVFRDGWGRLTTAVGNLEDRMGLRIWQGGKRGGEEDDEEAQMREDVEEEQNSDDGGVGSSSGGSSVTRTKEKEDQNEDSDTSDDYSSMEGEDLREKALNKREEEEGKEMSVLPHSAVDEESSVDNVGGSEAVALVNTPQEDEDITLL